MSWVAAVVQGPASCGWSGPDDDRVALGTLVGEDWSLVGNNTGATTDGKVCFSTASTTAPIEGVLPKTWRDAMVDDKGRVERIPYDLRVLVAPRDALRRRAISVAGGKKQVLKLSTLPGVENVALAPSQGREWPQRAA